VSLEPEGKFRVDAVRARIASDESPGPKSRGTPAGKPYHSEMPLSAGSRLGFYEVLAPLGAGGMGEVYRAKDSRLGRDVALKVLPTEAAGDAGRRSRFEQEARAASALAHPNIVAIYDVGESDGSVWIAMELIEGRTVRDLLASGPLPTRRALEIGTQVAEGLAAAHAAGIVHRDLKPENIILSKDGYVKILDFGLAKLVEHGFAAPDGPTVSAGAPATEPGTVMGTVGYMSPEQAAGQPVDFRSDQFSFGSILYELATGERAFQRKTGVETLAAILREEPKAIAEVNPASPAPLRWTIERCLAKEPDERFASTKDLARDLRSMRDHLSETSAAILPAASPRPRRSWLVPAAAALALGALLGALAVRKLGGAAPASQPAYRQVTFRRGTISGARFAPDGKTIIYSAAWDGKPSEVFGTQADSPESRPLGTSSATLAGISSSSDLAILLRRRFLVGFESAATLARVPLNGGAPRELADDITDADWSPDGQQLAVTRPEGGQWRLEYPIGKVLATSPGWMDQPRFSPDGRRLAYADHPQRGDGLGRVVVIDLAGRRLFQSGISTSVGGVAWSPKGDEVWYTGDSLMGVGPSGKSRTVLALLGSPTLCDVARDGRILITSNGRRREILGLDPGESSEHNLSWHDWSFPSDLSADGRTLLFDEQGAATGGGQTYLAYVRRTDGSPAVLLGKARSMSLSPDGRRVLAQSLTDPPELLILPTGAGTPRTVPIKGIALQWAIWMPDGRHAVVRASEGGRGARLYSVDTETGARRALSPEGASQFGRGVSPDGKLVAATAPNGRIVLYPTDGGEPRPVPGIEPGEIVVRWTGDGRGLYLSDSRKMPVAVSRLDLATGRREPIRSFAPADAAGVLNVGPVLLSADGRSYVYSYRRILDDLYVVTGAR
jgi:serine/threonine protein kinase/Tol biopolymer transport system component